MTNDLKTLSSKTPTSSRNLHVMGLLLVLAGAGWLVRYGLHRTAVRSWQIDPPLDQRLAAVRPTRSNSLSVEELQAINNAMPQFITARFVAGTPAPPLAVINDFANRVDWANPEDDQKKTEIAAIVAEFESEGFEEARRMVFDGIDRGYSSTGGGFDGYGVHIDNRWSKVLLAHARYLRDIKGDDAGARADLEMVLQLAYLYYDQATLEWIGHPNQSITWVSQLVCNWASQSKSIDGWDEFIARHMQTAAPRPVETLLAGEFVKVRALFDTIFVPEEDWLYIPRAIAPDHPDAYATERGWNLLSPVFANRSEADRRFNRFIECISDREAYGTLGHYHIAELPEDAFWTAVTMHQWEKEWRYLRVVTQHLMASTDLEGMLTVLALGTYYRDHEQFPEALEDLVPIYLPRLPMDYYVDRPLIYRRTEDAYLLYAVGRNGRDDGGIPEPKGLVRSEDHDVIYGFDRD